jgi:transposase
MLLTEKEINEKIQENDKIIKTTKKQTRDITIVKLYTEGLKYKEIAEKMKCSVSLVIKVLGSQRKKRSVRPRRQSEEDFIKTALQMKKQYSEGITVKQIMKAYDMTEKQVRHRLNKKIEKGEK